MLLERILALWLTIHIFIFTFVSCCSSSTVLNVSSTTSISSEDTTPTVTSRETTSDVSLTTASVRASSTILNVSSATSASSEHTTPTVALPRTTVNASLTTTSGSTPSTLTSTTTVSTTDNSDYLLAQQLDSVNFTSLASQALKRYYQKFWKGSVTKGHIQSDTSSMIWELAMGVFAMESYYEATSDVETKNRLSAEWEHLKATFSKNKLVGNMGRTPNLAADDAGWDAMAYMTFYRVTKDPLALQYAKECVLNAYEYFKDDDLSNGMWYCNATQYGGDQWKSVYSAAQVITALEYCQLTKGTKDYDASLYSETMKLYHWLEINLCRDAVKTYENCFQDGRSYTSRQIDYLYWCDYNENRNGRTERNGPDGLARPNDISWNGSVSALFGNMAMSAINAKLYKITGDSNYLTKALRTAASITERYKTTDNTYINDRDHNTNAAFAYYYIKEVLTLPGITQKDINRFANTGRIIANYGLTDDGYYHTNWEINAQSKGSEYQVCAVMGTNIHMITGSALLQKLGLFKQPAN